MNKQLSSKFQEAARHLSAMSAILDDLKEASKNLPCQTCDNDEKVQVIAGVCYRCFRLLTWKSPPYRDGVFGEFVVMVDVEEIAGFYDLRTRLVAQYGLS